MSESNPTGGPLPFEAHMSPLQQYSGRTTSALERLAEAHLEHLGAVPPPITHGWKTPAGEWVRLHVWWEKAPAPHCPRCDLEL